MIKATKTKSGKYTTLVPYYTADGKRHFKRFTDDTERKTINKAMSFTAEMNFLATNITVAQALEKYPQYGDIVLFKEIILLNFKKKKFPVFRPL